MDKRLRFPAKCPYCGRNEVWLFDANDVGLHLVKCDACQGDYAVNITVIPGITSVYALVPHIEEAPHA
jgi:hypothetical protein